MKSKVLFNKRYTDEDLYDLERDMGDAISPDHNPVCAELPIQEGGFRRGTFVVTILWEDQEVDE